jgi:hypothetical protein
MDLSLFLTQQSANNLPQTSALRGADGQLTDLGILFQNLLLGQLRDESAEVSSTKNAKGDQLTKSILYSAELDQQISHIANSIQIALSKDFAASKQDASVLNLQDFLRTLSNTITIDQNTARADAILLSDKTKVALLGLLVGTPQKPAQASTASPFTNTEASLDQNMLFEKILQNLNQSHTPHLNKEAVIAAGPSPQQFDTLSQQKTITLSKPSEQEDLPAELIALLGLSQTQPVQHSMVRIGMFPFLSAGGNDGGAWAIADRGTKAAGKGQTEFFTLEQLKSALIQKSDGAASTASMSKAAQMMTSVANENTTNISLPSHFDTFGEGMEWFSNGAQQWIAGHSPISATSGGNITAIITQSHSAGSTHPATHIIAVSLQKNTVNNANNESRNWTLQLDPPDLGKVEIRLQFTKDKLVKAQMIIEKPETWLMLQRDAQVLERALQGNDIDSDVSSISFELAGDHHDFTQNGRHDSQGNQSGTNSARQEDIKITDTSMTWFFDAESGLQRYNLVV